MAITLHPFALSDTVPTERGSWSIMLGGRVNPDVLRTHRRLYEDMNKGPKKLTERDKELVGLVAVGLTDDEIATQLQIPKHKVLNQIARLLAKLGIRDRVEIVLYAYSDPAMYQRISSQIIRKTTKNPQAQNPQVKQKAS